MKNIIIINGTMGVGKTTVCRELQKILPDNVFLDGDWCWNMNSFTVTEETKNMVIENIIFLLNNFIKCSIYKNIIFCWVMHEQSIIDTVTKGLIKTEYNLFTFSLIANERSLTKRLEPDIKCGKRDADIIKRSIARIKNYNMLDTIKIDTNDITPIAIAHKIIETINNSCTDV